MIGIFGLALVVAISVYQFATHGVGETGVSPGHRLHFFAAPLAATNLDGDPNAHPTCSAAHHDPRALNVCLMARRGPLVLAFFVTGAGQCVRQVSALQTLAGRFPAVQFAAVAIDGSHRATAALVRAHRWTIPGRLRPRRARGRPVRRGRLPDGRAGRPRRDRARSPHRGPLADRRRRWRPASGRCSRARRRRAEMGARPSPTPREGVVDPMIRDEFPGLRLRWVTVPGRPEPSPRELVRQLRDLSNRYRGGGVVSMRTKPVPQAYRAFFRQIGLDPDVRRIPSEEVAVARLVQGGFRSVDHIADACLVALIETGVPVWALDAERVDDAGLGIRRGGRAGGGRAWWWATAGACAPGCSRPRWPSTPWGRGPGA